MVTGRDFKPNEELSVADQVNKLVQKAVSAENLAQCFTGWCPFWVSNSSFCSFHPQSMVLMIPRLVHEQ